MKFSYQWMRELVPGLATEPAKLQRLITMHTAECEGIEAVGAPADLPPDWIIEIDNKSLTHRPDLWGHFGMAREIAAITGNPLFDPVKPGLLPPGDSALKVEIADHSLCPRYSALILENLTVAPSPAWLHARLESVGINSINNIVDVTNYILAELPQPMHAFDADKLAGTTIFVRNARPGEQLAALDSETYSLAASDLVIADASRAIALAGVIGGAATGISHATTRVVLESANFLASSVRLTSARHKLRTDASMRFEKSLDPENTMRGLARALELFQEVCPGLRVTGGVADNYVPPPPVKPILLPLSFVARKLGKAVTQHDVTRILKALGFTVAETAAGMLTVTVPTWRATKDISLKDDLVEEIGRMIGYDSIQPVAPSAACVVPPANPMRLYLRELRAQLTAQGFTEVHNYSFVNEADLRRFRFDPDAHIAVQNPIAAELTHLRRSLVPGLLKNIVANVRYYPEFRLFEIGNEIHPRPLPDLPHEATHLAAVFYNSLGNEQDFYELKRVLECAFPSASLSPADAQPYQHPARTAAIHWCNTVIGQIFELHPSSLEAEGIQGRAILFDIDLNVAQPLAAARIVMYTPLRKYPTSGFDLSVVADLRTPVKRIESELTRLAGSDLARIEFVRLYEGPPLQQGQKSVTYNLQVGSLDHTLTAEEMTEIRNRIIAGMHTAGFDLRGV